MSQFSRQKRKIRPLSFINTSLFMFLWIISTKKDVLKEPQIQLWLSSNSLQGSNDTLYAVIVKRLCNGVVLIVNMYFNFVITFYLVAELLFLQELKT